MHQPALIGEATPSVGLAPRRRKTFRLIPLLGALSVVLSVHGCSGKSSTKPDPAPRPDFHLQDVNPNSARSGQVISPRDYLGKVSAWYFGHST